MYDLSNSSGRMVQLTHRSSSAKMMRPSRRDTMPPRLLGRQQIRTRMEAPACTRPRSPSAPPPASRKKRHATARPVGITSAPHGLITMPTRTKRTRSTSTSTPRARRTHPSRDPPAPTTSNLRASGRSLSGNAPAPSSSRTSQRG